MVASCRRAARPALLNALPQWNTTSLLGLVASSLPPDFARCVAPVRAPPKTELLAAFAAGLLRRSTRRPTVSKTFADLGVPHELVSPLRKAGITEPFDIQAATIPDALDGRDILGRAPTGSGKTLAFGLPLLATIKKGKPHRPRSLILSPTRELAEQIRVELAPIAAGRGLRLLTVYGGVSYHPQRSKLKRGVDVLIACPGRLIDLLEQGDLTLEDVDYVVIDEADRMADMGFMPQVRELLDMTPDDRQTLLFSATLDGDVARLTQRYQTSPVRHEVGGDAHDAGTARHHFWRLEGNARLDMVADVVGAHESTLVFTRTRRGADRLARQLEKHGVKAEAIHGGRSQRQRDRALRNFKNGNAEALIATDVAARGIHVDGVECVIHFDPPEDHKAYLHRSGRTARAGAEGHVVSFIQHDQVRSTHRLQDHLGLRDGINSPSMEALFENGGELLGKRSDKPEGGASSRSRNGGGNGQRRNNSSNGSGQQNNRNRSRRPQDGRRRNGGGNPGRGNSSRGNSSRGNSNRGNTVAADRDGNRRDVEPTDREGNRIDSYSDRDGNRRGSGGSNGRNGSRNSSSRRGGQARRGSGGGTQRSNGSGGSSSGNRRRKPNSSGSSYRSNSSGSGGNSRSNSSRSSSGGGNSSRGNSNGNQQRRRKPSGNRTGR
ncbi:MAG: DEAD/DEAH box helicase [bacterium]|nr:DEAD/DEAH box helicase [bacterium]